MYIPQPITSRPEAVTQSTTLLSRAALFCIACLFALPFMWPRHTLPIPSFYNEAIAALLVLVAALLAICVSTKSETRFAPRAVPYVALIFLPLIAVLCIQFAMGKPTFAYNVLFPIMMMAVATGAAILGASCARRYGYEKLLTWIAIALIAGACWNVAAQFAQLTKTTGDFASLFTYSTGSLYGNLAQRNHLSTYLNWALIASLYLFAKGRLPLAGLISLLLVFLVGLALTASRMSWLQVIWTAGAGAYLVSKMARDQRPRHWRFILGLPLALLAVTLVLPFLIDLLQLNFSKTAIERLQTEGLDRNRWLIYSQAWEIFKAHPWLGIGPGELQFNQLLLMDHYKAVLFASSAHNLLLDLLVMTGVIGTAGFACFGIAWLLRIRKRPVSLETAAILLLLAALGIHTLLEFPEWYGFFLFPTAFFMGALETRCMLWRANLITRILPIVCVVYGVACTGILWFQYARLESLYVDHYQRNLKAKPASVELLAQLYAFREKSFFEGPADFLLNWNLSLDPAGIDQKLIYSGQAIRYEPRSNVLYRHIVLLCIAGKTDEAKFYLLRLKSSIPDGFDDVARELINASKAHPESFSEIAAEAERLRKKQ
ncbi:MAG TPA: Wzy polymerase domain-containing protein [Oxalicibacterium sp.]|nr:Wzy polymerase domain-containing protein [Oxalicibacterium sp.]